jgi:hypothetical protein
MRSSDNHKDKKRKPYEKPSITKLSPEQAKLKLLERARGGNQAAKELLELMFPEDANKLSHDKKKSA